MKFGINQAISQTITQLSCIQLETPSSRLWNFWWIKTYTTFNRRGLSYSVLPMPHGYVALVLLILGQSPPDKPHPDFIHPDINTLRPRQMAVIFQTTFSNAFFFNENVLISIKISLKFVPKGQINNNPALFQIMTWRRPGDKPLSEPMMVSSLTHICVTRPQRVNSRKTHTLDITHLGPLLLTWIYLNPNVDN